MCVGETISDLPSSVDGLCPTCAQSAQVSLGSEHCGDDHCFNRALVGDDFNQGRLCVSCI